MSISKNVFRLNCLYDLIQSGSIKYTEAGSLWVWGDNSYGTLGVSNLAPYSSPIQVPGTQWHVNNATGNDFTTFAFKTDGSTWVWGNNTYGEMGVGDTVHRSSPIQIFGNWCQINQSCNGGFGIKCDNTLWTWGLDAFGSSGVGTGVGSARSSPVQIPGNQWCCVSAGQYTTFAIKTDNTLWSWGVGYYGGLGNNSQIHRSSPVQIPGNQWKSVCSGFLATTSAIKNDNTLWVWGRNINGSQGLNYGANAYYSSPVQVPGTQWVEVSTNSSSAGRKSDGTLWVWGYNYYGQLGTGNTVCYSSPQQLPGTQWVDLHRNPACNTLARKADGTLWVWGKSASGMLANNTTGNYFNASSPIQVPGTLWTDIKTTAFSAFAIKSQ